MKITNADRQLVIDKAQRVIEETEKLIKSGSGHRSLCIVRIHTQQKLIKEMQEGMETEQYNFGAIDYSGTGENFIGTELQAAAYVNRLTSNVISKRRDNSIDPYPVRMKINGTWYAVTLTDIPDDGMNNEFF